MTTALLTHTSMSTLRTCPEKYRLSYVEQIRPERQADYFRLGGAYHLALELHGKGHGLAEIEKAIYENYAHPPEWVQSEETELQKWYYESITVITLFKGWLAHYANEPLIVVETERSFEVPILNPDTGHATQRYRFAGKRDKIVRLPDGRLSMVEHKTTSDEIEPGADYWERLKIDSQISGYYYAAGLEGIEIQTVLYDVTRKPIIRPSRVPLVDSDGVRIVYNAAGERVRTKDDKKWRETADAEQGYVLQTRLMTLTEWADKLAADIESRPDWYYQRQEIPRLQADLKQYAHELWHTQKLVAEFENNGRWYRNTAACLTRGGRCPYFELCTQGIKCGATVPQGFTRAPHAHPELAN